MRRTLIAFTLLLGACSNQEAGQSTYLDSPYVASAEQQALLEARRAEADRVLAANLASEGERRALASQYEQPPFLEGPRGEVVLAPQATPLPRTGAGSDTALVASLEAAIDAAGQETPNTATTPAAPNPIELAPGTEAAVATAPQAVAPGGTGQISDDSFGTVTARETIESDAERLRRLSEQTITLEAEPLPTTTTAANLVAFAKSTTHRIGQRVYSRSGARSSAAAARTCRSYGNPDEAQRAFLSRGGPEADPMKLDPDGDGFVCGWSPDPFRALGVGN